MPPGVSANWFFNLLTAPPLYLVERGQRGEVDLGRGVRSLSKSIAAHTLVRPLT